MVFPAEFSVKNRINTKVTRDKMSCISLHRCWCSAAPRAGERRRVCAWSCQNSRNKTLGVFRQLSGNRRRICKSENRKGTNTIKTQNASQFFSVFILVSSFNQRHLCVLILSAAYLQLRFKFSRVREKFEAPACFSDRSIADVKKGQITCASYQDSRFSVKQMQRDRGIQAVASLQSSSTQTLR